MPAGQQDDIPRVLVSAARSTPLPGDLLFLALLVQAHQLCFEKLEVLVGQFT